MKRFTSPICKYSVNRPLELRWNANSSKKTQLVPTLVSTLGHPNEFHFFGMPGAILFRQRTLPMVGPFFMGLSVGVLWKLFFIARHGSNLSAKTVVGGVCSRKTRKVHCFRYDGTVMAEDWGKLFYSEQLLVAWGWKQEGECVFTVSRKAVGCFGDVHIVAQR